MIELKNIDLRADPAAGPYVKDEIVLVEFAHANGELMSLEGANRYEPGDALITEVCAPDEAQLIVTADAVRETLSLKSMVRLVLVVTPRALFAGTVLVTLGAWSIANEKA